MSEDKKGSILLVEDEENLHEALKLNLELDGSNNRLVSARDAGSRQICMLIAAIQREAHFLWGIRGHQDMTTGDGKLDMQDHVFDFGSNWRMTGFGRDIAEALYATATEFGPEY